MATAAVIQGCWVFHWGKLPSYWASTKPKYCPCMRTQTRVPAKGQVTHWESRAPAVPPCVCWPLPASAPCYPAVCTAISTMWAWALILSQAPFAPAFSGINDCVQIVQSPVHLIWFPYITGKPEQTQSSLSMCENPWGDHPACLLHTQASICTGSTYTLLKGEYAVYLQEGNFKSGR